jgi:hypothetical protein
VLKFVMTVQKSVRNMQLIMQVAKNVLKLVKNVLRSVQNMLLLRPNFNQKGERRIPSDFIFSSIKRMN